MQGDKIKVQLLSMKNRSLYVFSEQYIFAKETR